MEFGGSGHGEVSKEQLQLVVTSAKATRYQNGHAPFGTPWTAQAVARLKKLWGTVRVGGIAAELGLTRNAVIGKAHRLGLEKLNPSHSLGPRKPKTPRHSALDLNFRKRRQAAPNRPPREPIPSPLDFDLIIPQAQRKTLLELGKTDCRWSVNDVGAADFFFCGGKQKEDSSYCEAHFHRGTQKRVR